MTDTEIAASDWQIGIQSVLKVGHQKEKHRSEQGQLATPQ